MTDKDLFWFIVQTKYLELQLTEQESIHRMLPGLRFFPKRKNASLRTGSAHGEMLIEFLAKNEIKSNFSINLRPSR